MTTRTPVNQVIRGEISLARGDLDDDLLQWGDLDDDTIMVAFDGSTIWEKKPHEATTTRTQI